MQPSSGVAFPAPSPTIFTLCENKQFWSTVYIIYIYICYISCSHLSPCTNQNHPTSPPRSCKQLLKFMAKPCVWGIWWYSLSSGSWLGKSVEFWGPHLFFKARVHRMSPCLSHFCHSNLQNCHKEHAICICIEDLLTKMTMFHYHLRSPQSVVSTVFRSPLRRAEPAATDQPRLAIAVTKLTVTHFHEPQWQPHTGLSEKNKNNTFFGDKNSKLFDIESKDNNGFYQSTDVAVGFGLEAETTSPRCRWPVDSSRSPGNHPELRLSAWGWAS